MTATLIQTTVRTAMPRTGSLLPTGCVAAAAASVATTAVAAAGQAAGISLDMGGAPIPVPGFGVLTLVFSLVGLVLAAVLARRPCTRAAPSSGPQSC